MLISILTALAVSGLVYKAETTIDGAIQLKKAGNNLLSQAGIDPSMLAAFQQPKQVAPQTAPVPQTAVPQQPPVYPADNDDDIFCEECVTPEEVDIITPAEEPQPEKKDNKKKKK